MGEAIRATCTTDKVALLACYDKYRRERCENHGRMHSTDVLFLCLPTPTRGMRQDQAALHETLADLAEVEYQGVVVVKSTVVPGSMDRFAWTFPKLRLVHNPEFLSERFAADHYREEANWLMSGAGQDIDVVWSLLKATTSAQYLFSSSIYRTTELAKYLHNCMLAVKLSFLNEVYDAVGDHDTFERSLAMAGLFGNIGTHSRVPGPDGQRGWGGMCFPKDTLAFLGAFERDMPTLRGAIKTNTKLRPKDMKL